ncbi:MAG: hypothetical protein ACFFC7_07825 [Candidatus Hermodarchaeota archaeon]
MVREYGHSTPNLVEIHVERTSYICQLLPVNDKSISEEDPNSPEDKSSPRYGTYQSYACGGQTAASVEQPKYSFKYFNARVS